MNVSGSPAFGQLAEVDVGLADGVDAGRVERLDVPAPERAAHGLVEHVLAPDALDDHRRRDLALAKAGHLQLAPQAPRGVLDAALDLVGGDLGLHAHARLGQLGDGGLHVWHLASDDTVNAVHDLRPRSERISARLATGPVGHLVCGVADWAELLGRYLLSRRSRA